MGWVRGVIFYLGKSPAAKHAKAAGNLMLEDDGFLSQQFRSSLLKTPEHFRAGVAISELAPVDIEWFSVGQNAGVALWVRDAKVGAASILLNGLEGAQEIKNIEGGFESRRLPLPSTLWEQVAAAPRPLLITVHYDLRSFTDPVIVTAAETLANAFFTIFGTNADEG